eukprot:293637-Amphidinium_carterae.1
MASGTFRLCLRGRSWLLVYRSQPLRARHSNWRKPPVQLSSSTASDHVPLQRGLSLNKPSSRRRWRSTSKRSPLKRASMTPETMQIRLEDRLRKPQTGLERRLWKKQMSSPLRMWKSTNPPWRRSSLRERHRRWPQSEPVPLIGCRTKRTSTTTATF